MSLSPSETSEFGFKLSVTFNLVNTSGVPRQLSPLLPWIDSQPSNRRPTEQWKSVVNNLCYLHLPSNFRYQFEVNDISRSMSVDALLLRSSTLVLGLGSRGGQL